MTTTILFLSDILEVLLAQLSVPSLLEDVLHLDSQIPVSWESFPVTVCFSSFGLFYQDTRLLDHSSFLAGLSEIN